MAQTAETANIVLPGFGATTRPVEAIKHAFNKPCCAPPWKLGIHPPASPTTHVPSGDQPQTAISPLQQHTRSCQGMHCWQYIIIDAALTHISLLLRAAGCCMPLGPQQCSSASEVPNSPGCRAAPHQPELAQTAHEQHFLHQTIAAAPTLAKSGISNSMMSFTAAVTPSSCLWHLHIRQPGQQLCCMQQALLRLLLSHPSGPTCAPLTKPFPTSTL